MSNPPFEIKIFFVTTDTRWNCLKVVLENIQLYV